MFLCKEAEMKEKEEINRYTHKWEIVDLNGVER